MILQSPHASVACAGPALMAVASASEKELGRTLAERSC